MMPLYFHLTLFAVLGMGALFLYQAWRRDATIVDVGWAFGLAVAAALVAVEGTGDPARRLLVAAATGAWSLRLALYLLRHRVLRRVGEDGRYARMRRAMGRYAQPGFFLFFQLQAGFILLFALPPVAAAANPLPLRPLDLLGLAIVLLAIGGEVLADRQLTRHRADPANAHRTCRTGLWRYSRHPNYFCEWLHWFAYLCWAAGGPHWWLAALGPVLMLLFLLFVTGIPHTERQAASHRPDYADYQRTTSAFLPWFPRA